MVTVLEIVLPVFLLIALGYFLRRIRLVDDTFFSQVNQLVYYVCLPLLLIHKIATADFATSFNLGLVLGCSVSVGVVFVISYLIGWLRGFSAPVHGAFCQGAFRGNLAYIGLAIIFNAYGDAGLTRAGVLLGFLVLVLNLFAILALLLPQKQQRTSFLGIARQIGSNPLILASLMGLLWSFYQLPMPTVVDRTLDIATGMALPLALLSIGGGFSLAKLKGDVGKAAFVVCLKLLLLPLITAGCLLWLNITGIDLAIGILLAGAPTAVATYVMASQMGADKELAASIVMLATAFSAFSYTMLLLCLRSYGL
jgi:predicted permease